MMQYKIALLLAAIFTALLWSGAFYVRGLSTDLIVMSIGFGPVTVLGLVLLSRFVRYVAGVFLLVWGVGTCWQILSQLQHIAVPLLIYFSALALICLCLAALLLASKKFSVEFNRRRETMPKWMILSRRVFHWALGLAAAAATINDVINLTKVP